LAPTNFSPVKCQILDVDNVFTQDPTNDFKFQLKLVDIESVELLDKRGYLTICMTLVKEGKIYLRRPEGIKDWYSSLQVLYIS
jgi:hypothetical protein